MAGPVGTCIVSVVRGGGSGSDDRGHELVQQAMANKRALCEACGFRCLLDSSGAFGAHGRHPSWDKVMALQHALRIRPRAVLHEVEGTHFDFLTDNAHEVAQVANEFLLGATALLG